MLGRLGALFTDSLALLNQPAHFAELDRFARLPQVVLLVQRHPSFGTPPGVMIRLLRGEVSNTTT